MERMKKHGLFAWGAALLAVITALLIFSGCKQIISLEKAEAVCTSDAASYEIDAFDYGDYFLRLTYSDGSVKEEPLTEDMLSEYDRLQLKNPGVHTMTVKYENKTITFTVKITRKQIVTDESQGSIAPYLPSPTLSYDGRPHSVTVEGDVPQGATVLYPYGNTFTDAGIYPITAIVKADGYETITLEATLTIQQSTYIFDGFALVADYGVGDGGEALTSFVYDGLSHGVSFVGTYPAELGEPKLTIMNLKDKNAVYRDGSTAVDAGNYRVRAVFAGDSLNYSPDNLVYECDFVISKKPISVDVLNAIKFEDQTVYYDGKAHRIDIGAVQLPDGISVGYYAEDGKTPFGTRTDVNEKGYVVICKFESDNPNLEIINEKRAILRIMKVNYVNIDELHIGFLDESVATTYDGTAHLLKVFGLNKNVTVAKFVWNKSEDEKIEITSLTDVYVDGLGNEQSYNVTAYFNTPSDGNHNDIAPITAELTVMKASFNPPEYTFESVTAAYSENATYTLSYLEQYLPVGMTTSVSYLAPGDTETHPGVPTVTCLPYNESSPLAGYGVGVYTCTVTFSYTATNYANPPATALDPVVRTLEIVERTYDAKEIINVADVRDVYEVGKNRLALCNFSEALPSWVSPNFLRVAKVKDESGNLIGPELYEAVDAGEYGYFFRFSYFNGTEIAFVESETATLKIAGLPIHDKYFSITHGSAFTYDGTTDCLPHVTGTKDNLGAVITPENLVYSVSYFFAEPGIDQFPDEPNYKKSFTLTYVDTDNGEKCPLALDEEAVALATQAGNHKFEITISGPNFEPLTVGFTLTVNQKKLTISHTKWAVSSEGVTAVFDGKSHESEFLFAEEPPEEEKALVTCSPKLLSQVPAGKTPGVDVGEYSYTLSFKCINQNYYIEAENDYLFEYTVKITSRDVRTTEGSGYAPVGIYYTSAFSREWYRETFGSPFTKTIKEGELGFEIAKLYGNKVSDTEYTVTARDIGFPWYSGEDLEIFHISPAAAEDEDLQRIRALINDAFGKDATVYIAGPQGTQTINGLSDITVDPNEVTKEMCKDIDLSLCGNYVIFVVSPSDNVLIDGSRAFVLTYRARTLETTPMAPKKENVNLTQEEDEVYAALNIVPSTANASTLSDFDGARMLVYSTVADGNTVTACLFSHTKGIHYTELSAQKSYIVCCDKDGNILRNASTLQSVYPISAINGAVTRGELSSIGYTEAGTYYIFVNLGPNVMWVDGGSEGIHRFVVRIDVAPYTVTAANLVSVKATDGTAYAQSASRLYNTDAAQVTYAYGDHAAINGVDNVTLGQSYNGKPTYVYNTVYDGKSIGVSFLKDVPTALLDNAKFGLLRTAYSFKDGGASLNALYQNRSFSKLSYSQLLSSAAALCSTDTAKNGGYTSVGLYYLFVTVESKDIACPDGNSFVISIKVDRSDADACYQYEWENKAYDMRSSTNPYPKTTYTFVANKTLVFNQQTALHTQLEANGVTSVTFTGTYWVDTDDAASSVMGTHDLTVTFRMSTERFGGYTITETAPLLEITKKPIDLSDMSHPAWNFTLNTTADFNRTNLFEKNYTDFYENQLKALGVAEEDAAEMVKKLSYTYKLGTATVTSLYVKGTYDCYPVFALTGSETCLLRYDLQAGTKFTKTASAYTSTGLYSHISSMDKQYDLYLADDDNQTNAVGSWAPVPFTAGEDRNDPVNIVKHYYLFIGMYYDDTHPNVFLQCLTNALGSASLAEEWVTEHVSKTSQSIKVDISGLTQYFRIVIQAWDNNRNSSTFGTVIGLEPLSDSVYQV